MGDERSADYYVEEWQQIARLLGSIQPSDALELPVCVEHRGTASPDFIFSTRQRRIGVEVTSCTPEQVRRARALQPNNYLPWIDIGAIAAGHPFRKNCDLLRAMQTISSEDQDASEDIVRTADSVESAVRRKRVKFQQGEFMKVDENWLLVHDNYNAADAFTLELLPAEIHGRLTKLSCVAVDFGRIYIYIGALEFRWCSKKLSMRILNGRRLGV